MLAPQIHLNRRRPRRHRNPVRIQHVPERRIGHALLHSCMVQAREEGFQALSLSVAVHNRSRMMYQRAGFEKVGESGGSSDTWTMLANL